MFCPHCGNESAQELNYCKRCGGNLNPPASAQQVPPAALPARTAWAVGTTTLLLVIMGMGILFAALSELKHSGLPPDVIKTVVSLGMLTLLGSVAMLVWLWTRLLGGPRHAPAPPPPQLNRPAVNTNELGAANFNSLASAPAPSVTEHTTRTLEIVNRES